MLVLDLPGDLAEGIANRITEAAGRTLASDPQIAKERDLIQRRYGTPATWRIGVMLPVWSRRRVLRGLLDDLRRAGAPMLDPIGRE